MRATPPGGKRSCLDRDYRYACVATRTAKAHIITWESYDRGVHSRPLLSKPLSPRTALGQPPGNIKFMIIERNAKALLSSINNTETVHQILLRLHCNEIDEAQSASWMHSFFFFPSFIFFAKRKVLLRYSRAPFAVSVSFNAVDFRGDKHSMYLFTNRKIKT